MWCKLKGAGVREAFTKRRGSPLHYVETLCRNNFVFLRKTKSSICIMHTLEGYEIQALSIVFKLFFNSVNCM